ncbi:MAG TPA: hypothetical protein VFH61_05665 [Thermoleophilia bacterium]|nr:hypothetical protein [Thermoleophilia bacterium]
MAALTPIRITPTGTAGALTAAASGGDTYRNSPTTYCEVDNANTVAMTVTATRSRTVVRKINFNEIAISDIALSVANAARQLFKAPMGSHTSGGNVSLTYSSVVSLTVGAFEVVLD